MSGLAIGTGVLAGVGGYFLGRPKKSGNLNLGPVISPTIEGNADLQRTVKGRQTGFGSGFEERVTSPFVQQLRQAFPTARQSLLDEAGGMGFGRSTKALQGIGELQGQRDLDIQKVLSEASLLNLQQGKIDVQNKDAFLRSLINDAAAQEALSRGDVSAKRGFQISQEEAFKERERKNQQAALGTGLSVFGGMGGFGGANTGTANVGGGSFQSVLGTGSAGQSLGSGLGGNLSTFSNQSNLSSATKAKLFDDLLAASPFT